MNPLRNWRIFISAENLLASLNISQDGELVMLAMATPGKFSIECDRSDIDHVCLGKIEITTLFHKISSQFHLKSK